LKQSRLLFLNRDLLLVFTLAIVAWSLNWFLDQSDLFSPGASTIAMFVGMGIALATGRDLRGGSIVINGFLPVAIIMLGFELDFSVIHASDVGITGATAIAGTVVLSFVVAAVGARLFGLASSSGLALGAGGAICGNSAVLAVAPSLRLKPEDTALVLAVINLLGLVMFFVVVGGANLLNLDPIAAGIWAGASVHIVPQAIAAGEAIGPDGMAVATAVKLSRVSLLVLVVPLSTILGRRLATDDVNDARIPACKAVFRLPLYTLGFVLAVALGNLLLPDQTAGVLGSGGRLILLPVLAAVGLTVTRSILRSAGGRLLFVGILSTTALALGSLVAILLIYD
jgi:uncharacterized integral membrane protein (TIGR00698 family)